MSGCIIHNPFLTFDQKDHALPGHCTPTHLKSNLVTSPKSSIASHQRNMAILQAPLVTNQTTLHSFLVRLSEKVKSLKPFPKKHYSMNQITTAQESSHTSGNESTERIILRCSPLRLMNKSYEAESLLKRTGTVDRQLVLTRAFSAKASMPDTLQR